VSRTIHKTENPVTLEGFQAILAPSKFGYSLAAVVDDSIINTLEAERTEVLKWAESKLKNPKRSTLKPEPWEEVAEGKYKIKFSWNAENRPPVVDTEGTPVTDEKTPLLMKRHLCMADLLLNWVSIRSLISSEMELPMVVLSSWLVYRLSQ